MEPKELTPEQQQAEDSLVMRRQLERISEPWYLNKVVSVAGAFIMAMILGSLAATGDIETIILIAVWVIAVLIIIFVRDYWWSPALIITALSLSTYVVGFKLTGLEVGMVILALTFPVKLAMKTLWPAKPKMDPGPIYWALIGYVALHAIVIFFYSKIDGAAQIKNIVKAYYGALAPLVLYGMLIRYCDPKTVFRTGVILFGIWILTSISAIFVILRGIEINELTALKINVGFVDVDSATGFLRITGPYIFISAIAFWPAARNRQRLLLLFAGILGIVGTMLSTGRVAFFSCVIGGFFFAVVRKRLWLALPVIVLAALAAGICTLDPEFLYSLPDGIQRTLTPFNFSEQRTVVQETAHESDRWHQELRADSIPYWTQDTTSFYFGHGFKSWDDSVFTSTAGTLNVDFDALKQFAMEMGRTENMFSSVTNIFGLVGLVLYGGFLGQLAWLSWKGRRLSPERSVERAVCEFSFVILVTSIVLAWTVGGVPDIIMIYWALGVLAARPYLGVPEKEVVPVRFASFDRSHDATPRPARSAFASDPLAAFAEAQAHAPLARHRRKPG